MSRFTPRIETPESETSQPFMQLLYRLGILFVTGSLVLTALSGLAWLFAPDRISQVLAETVLLVVFIPTLILLLWSLVAMFGFGRAAWRQRRWMTIPLVALALLQILSTGQMVFWYADWFDATLLIVSAVSLVLVLYMLWYSWHFWPHFSGSVRYLRLQIPLLILLSPFLLFLTLNLLFTDSAPVADNDLLVTTVEPLPEAENMYYGLPTKESLTVPEERSIEMALALYATSTFPANLASVEVDTLARTTKPVVDQFMSAVEREGYQCPSTVNNFSLQTDFCSLNIQRDLAKLAAFHAAVAVAEEDYAQAVNYAVAINRFAFQLQKNPTPRVIDALVVNVIYDIGIDTASSVASELQKQDSELSSELLTEIALALDMYQIDTTILERAFKIEYMEFKDVVENLGQQSTYDLPDVPTSYVWHPNRTTAKFAKLYRGAIAQVELACTAPTAEARALAIAMENYVREVTNEQIFTMMLKPNAVGSILFQVVASSQGGVGAQFCETQVRQIELKQQL